MNFALIRDIPALYALFKSLIVLILLIIFKIAIYPILKKKSEKTRTELDDKIIGLISPSIYLMIFVGFTYYFYKDLLPDTELIGKVIFTILILFGGWIITKLLDIIILEVISHMHGSKKDIKDFINNAYPLLSRLVKIVIFFIFILVILDKWNINIGPFLTSAGIIGIGIGFAMKDMMENTLSGIIILLDKPFKIGDVVETSDGDVGTIIDISLRTTRIKRFSNDIVLIPNSKMINSKVVNYNLPDKKVRVELKIGVEYGSDIEKVKRVLKRPFKKMPYILSEKEPEILFSEMGDYALIFTVKYWVMLQDKLKSIDDYLTEAYKELGKAGIGIPFPTTTIEIKKFKK